MIIMGIGKVEEREVTDGRTDALAILLVVVEDTEEIILEVGLQTITVMVVAVGDEVAVVPPEDEPAEAICPAAEEVDKGPVAETTVALIDINSIFMLRVYCLPIFVDFILKSTLKVETLGKRKKSEV
jgi:hypothetical protein